MYNFNKILVALDHTDLDKELIEASAFLSLLAHTEEVHFIHVIKNVDIPKSIKKEFPNLIKDALRDRKDEIQRNVDRYFVNKKSKIKIEIKSGQVTKSILKYSATQDIDLILLGRKNNDNGGGVIIQRLARRAGCSLVIIPKGFKGRIRSILVPIDFSSHAKDALLQAINLIKDEIPKTKIITQNVYQVPSGYHYAGKSFSEFAKIMKENAQKDYEAFVKNLNTEGLKIDPVYALDRHDNIISVIYKTAKRTKVDVIVVGAKGINSTAALFIGSSAEKLIQVDADIPVMIVRPKGKQKGILDFLMEL